MYINTKGRRKRNIKLKLLIMVSFLFITAIVVFTFIDREIMPTVQAIGELKAQEVTTRAVNQAVSLVLEGGIRYEDLISVKEDSEGNVTLMQANTMAMNKVASDVALTIQEQLNQIKTTSDRIPLGNALGSQLLAQYGPKIKLTVTPVGMVDVNFGTEFQQSGINQTRHRIFLIINTNVRVIVPFSTNRIAVTTYVPIAETIIVGKVPMTYIQVPEDRFLNITPINDGN